MVARQRAPAGERIISLLPLAQEDPTIRVKYRVDDALEDSGVGTWAIDPSFGLISLSPASRSIAGISFSNADYPIGFMLDLIHPADREAVQIRLQSARLTGSFYAEYRVVPSRGDPERWVRATGRRSDETGCALAGVLLDVTDQVRARVHVKEADDRLKFIQRASGIGFFEVFVGGRTHLSDEWKLLHGLPQHQAGISLQEMSNLIHPDDRAATMARFLRSRDPSDDIEIVYRIVRANDGAERWLLNRASLRRDRAGNIEHVAGAVLDITDRQRADLALQEAKALSHAIVESLSDVIAVLDADGLFIHMNESGKRTVEIESTDKFVGLPWVGFWPDASQPEAVAALSAAKSGRIGRFSADTTTAKNQNISFDVVVTPIRDPNGIVTQIVTIARDITEYRLSRAKLQWAANYDFLTELANRKVFTERISVELEGPKPGSVLLLDLDHFKDVNDTLGHAAGDALLRGVAARLQAALGEGHVAARLGGDEFALLLPRVDTAESVRHFVGRLQSILGEPLYHDGQPMECRVSIGAALYPIDGSDPGTLLKKADMALYGAKSEGRGSLAIFAAEHREFVQQRLSMARLARAALHNDAISPFYQPKVLLESGSFAGVEALLRWEDHRGEIHGPALIASAFEDAELARAIGQRMQEKVIADIQSWNRQKLAFDHVAINAAAPEFRADNFAEEMLERLQRAKVPTSAIELEITEGVFMGPHAGKVGRALRLLHDNGVRIALDDFGTGFSSLSHIKDFPVDVLKIDRSFINAADVKEAAIVRAVLNLGKSLGIRVVAEGIETDKQAQYLREQGCQFGQGFLFARPMAADALVKFLGRLPGRAGDTDSSRRPNAEDGCSNYHDGLDGAST
jgi:diguanylate cyclase (GGDEF)-like protein/PAS domain S-box-containing protein